MATKSGHSDNLITLSLRRSPTREVTTPFILRARRPRQYTAFLVFTQEKSACFLSLPDDCGEDDEKRMQQTVLIHISFTSKKLKQV